MTEVKDKEIVEEEYNGDDFVLYKKGGKIIGGGFDINSILMTKGLPSITTYNKPRNSEGEKVSDLFKNLVVPSGLYYMSMKTQPDKYGYKYDEDDDEERSYSKNSDVISDDIYEKLLGLVTVDNKDINKKKRSTRKVVSDKKNKTKKIKNK